MHEIADGSFSRRVDSQAHHAWPGALTCLSMRRGSVGFVYFRCGLDSGRNASIPGNLPMVKVSFMNVHSALRK